MAVRLFDDEGGDGWSDLASRGANEVTILLKEVLAKVEAEAGGPIDLRDFHYVVQHGLGGFVADLSIRRRLGSGDEQPKDSISWYPRLEPLEDI